jgi:hypothetical protein
LNGRVEQGAHRRRRRHRRRKLTKQPDVPHVHRSGESIRPHSNR